MGLPSLFSSAAPDSPRKLFLAILVSDAAMQAALWEVVGQEIMILERSSVHFYKDLQHCVVQADKALQELGKQSENVDEVIFGLEPLWVDASGIKEEKKPFLKKMTDDLSLKAVGFVVTIEALAQDIAQTGGTSSFILLELGQSVLQVSVIQHGKLKDTAQVGQSGTIAADVTEALARFKHEQTTESLPNTFTLFSLLATDSEVNEAEQALINHDWVAAGILTQPPVIEIAVPHLLLEAITRQGGRAVAQSMGLVKGGSGKVTSVASPPTSFGIPMPVNVGLVDATPVPSQPRFLETQLPQVDETKLADDEDSDEKPPTSLWGKLPLKKILANPAKRPFVMGGFVLGLVTVALVGFVYLFMTSTAVAIIQLKTNSISKEIEVTLDPNAVVPDPAALTLPAKRITTEVTGSDSLAATGTKLVGDPAKGAVTIFNKSTSTKTFVAGTIFKTGQYNFTLDEEVTIASASVSSSSGSETKTFGKADSKITAAQIGEEGNLAANAEFAIASFDSSTYSATNPQPFVGGASREVRVVSADDRRNLEQTLKNRLLTESETAFRTQTGPGEFVAITGRITIGQATFNAKVGEEVNQLTLDMTAEVEGLSYTTQDLQPLAEQVLAEQVPEGQELLPEALQMLSSALPAASTSAQVKLTANLSSQVRAAITPESLETEIAGKSVTHAESNLKANSQVTGVQFIFQPSLAATLLRRLPPVARLEVQIK